MRRGVEDRVARRIVDRDAQMQRVPRGGRRFGARDLVGKASGRRSRRPITVSRTPLSDQALRPRWRDRSAAAPSAPRLRSAAGASCRLENAYSVSVPMPCSGAASTTRRIASTPASMAAQARQPAPRRPAAVAVHDDADMQLRASCASVWSRVLCIAKSPVKKRDGDQAGRMPSRRRAASSLPAALAASRTRLLEHGEIVEKTRRPLWSGGRWCAAGCLRSPW